MVTPMFTTSTTTVYFVLCLHYMYCKEDKIENEIIKALVRTTILAILLVGYFSCEKLHNIIIIILGRNLILVVCKGMLHDFTLNSYIDYYRLISDCVGPSNPGVFPGHYVDVVTSQPTR